MRRASTGGMYQTCASWLTRSASGAAKSRSRWMVLLSKKLSQHGARAIQRDRAFKNGDFWEVYGSPANVPFEPWHTLVLVRLIVESARLHAKRHLI